jgi:hypothetical protein
MIALTTACAKSPDKIQAIAIQGNFKCSEEKPTLAALEAPQRNARNGDTIGVILTGIPVSSLAGNDLETQVAVAKGRVAACK